MITVTSTQLLTWIAAFMWPLTRILGLISTVPLLSNVNVPMRIKVALGIMIALVVAPSLGEMPAIDMVSFEGVFLLAMQFFIGAAMGFTVRIVFAAVEMAGAATGLTMGLGFATFFDPVTEGQSSVISQFLSLLALTIYIATNLHLVVLTVLIDSFETIPVSTIPLGGQFFLDIVHWGGRIFSGGLQLALPMIAVLLITNMSLGILTRAAPQLNLFGIGFPVTIGVGFVIISLMLPYFVTPIMQIFQESIGIIQQISTSPPPI